MKGVLRRIFTALSYTLKKKKDLKVNNLSFHLGGLEKEEQLKIKASGRKDKD